MMSAPACADSRWFTITPWLKKVAHLLSAVEVSEILINSDGRVYVEREGVLHLVDGVVIAEGTRRTAAQQIALTLGHECNEETPMLDASLPDGSRVAAVLAPVSVGGTILTIRKFRQRTFTAEELCRLGMFSTSTLVRFSGTVVGRKTILISGIPGSGKTTLLNALAAYIPKDERIVLIEDTSEIDLHGKHLVRMVTRPEQLGSPAITIRDLLRKTLRLRPDRIIVGEVRGAEAFDLLMAMNSGAKGTISTLHASSARDAIQKLRTYVATAADSANMTYRSLGMYIANHIDCVVQTERVNGKRVVSQIVDVGRYDAEQDDYVLTEWEL